MGIVPKSGHKPKPVKNPRLSRFIIEGLSVRDYAYQWINGGCLLHQWCSGARGIDRAVIEYVGRLRKSLPFPTQAHDVHNLATLGDYLEDHIGHTPEKYIPDEFGLSPHN